MRLFTRWIPIPLVAVAAYSVLVPLLPAGKLDAQVVGQADAAVDSLLAQMWESAIAGADAGVECLDDQAEARNRSGCEAMQRQFARFDSLTGQVQRVRDKAGPLIVTERKIPLAEVPQSLLELADSVVAAVGATDAERVMFWDANLRSVWITAQRDRKRLPRDD